MFKFHANGGSVNLTISPALFHPNLNIKATLTNASNVVLATSDPAGLGAAIINQVLGAGDYYITVDGVGEGSPATTGYSDYGSLGLFTVSGTIGNVLRNPDNPANTVNGLDYKYFEGNWTVLPDFSLTPIKTGTVNNFDLSPRNRDDNFGFRFTGYINVPADGIYAFYTNSDDGSKLYIGNTLVVNNDGLHAATEKIGTIGLKTGKHSITIDYFDANFSETLAVSYSGPTISKVPVPAAALFRVTSPLRDPDNPANTVNGLDYKYFQGNWTVLPDFGTLSPVKTGTVNNFDLSPRNQNDNFGFRFTGFINVPTDGVYTLYTSSDDGSKLYIGSTLVVNNDGLHGAVEKSGTIGLKAGKHAVTVDFFDGQFSESLAVSYSGPGISKTTVPNSALFRSVTTTFRDPENPSGTVNGLSYKYFQGTWSVIPDFGAMSPVKTGTVNTFDLSPRNQNDNFGFRYTGYINVPADGVYTLYTASDDGSKLYIGSTLVVNNDGLHAVVEQSGTIGLKAGKHAITVDYFDAAFGESIAVSYSGPGIAKTTVPASALFRAPGLRDAENPNNVVNGLFYRYFQGSWSVLPDFGVMSPIKTGSVNNFDLSPKNQNDYFGFRFTGYVNVPKDGSYTFYTNSDDGSKLYIGSTLVVNNDGFHGPIEKSGTIGLRAGKHLVTVDFFEASFGESLSVSYEGGGISKQAITNGALYRTPTGPSLRLASESIAAGTDRGIQSIYPNPASDKAIISYLSDTKQVLDIEITDLSGRKITGIQHPVDAGLNEVTILLNTVNPGIYLVRIINSGAKSVQKIVVNK